MKLISAVALLASGITQSAATDLKLDWKDCGDASTHTKITAFTPATLTLGQSTTMSGTGTLDADIADADFDIELSGALGHMLSCKGDASSTKSCSLPLGTGTVTFEGMTFPLKKGATTVNVGIKLSTSLPSALFATTTTATATSKTGGKIFCIQIKTSKDAFGDFINRFDKVYTNEADFEKASANFEKNYKFINAENAKGVNTYELGVNYFTDLSLEDFGAQYFGYKQDAQALPSLGLHEYKGEELADSVDWRTKGAVTPVKNQGQCGSCWSFSTTGALEGAWVIIHGGPLVSLSEEQLVQCDTGSAGCGGGSMQQAFGWVQSNMLCTEKSYSYTSGGGVGGSCHSSGCTIGIPYDGVTGFKTVGQSEQALMSAVSQQPVSIAVEADKSVFQSYKSGVMTGACGTQLDHGILCIGYGEESGNKYWLVKNSWGTVWGEAGFGKLLRGKNSAGECGILMGAVYPQVAPCNVVV